MSEGRGTRLGRAGARRLPDLLQSVMPWQHLFGGTVLPRVGRPEPARVAGGPEQALPGSYIAEHERQRAVQRERARRFVRSRRPGGEG